MDAIRKIVRSGYFPAGVVLTGVILFWTVALAGGLSLLNNRSLPIATLAWMLFVYLIAVLSPVAGFMAAKDLVRRYRRDRAAARKYPDGGPSPRSRDRTQANGQKAV